MCRSFPQPDSPDGDNNSPRRGRPGNYETSDGVVAIQRILSKAHRITARSSVSGRQLNDRACALILWRIQEEARAAGVPDYFGSPGVPKLERTRDPDGRLRVDRLWDEELVAVRDRLQVSEPDEAAVAEAVARRYGPDETPAAKRFMYRLKHEKVEQLEYRHLGEDRRTGRQPLSPLRRYKCSQCGASLTAGRWRPCCSRACLIAQVLQRAGHRCERCGATPVVSVRPPVESDVYCLDSLVTRCLACFKQEHTTG